MRVGLLAAIVLAAFALAGCGDGKTDEEVVDEQIEKLKTEVDALDDPTSEVTRTQPEYIRFRKEADEICAKAVAANRRTDLEGLRTAPKALRWSRRWQSPTGRPLTRSPSCGRRRPRSPTSRRS